MGHPCKRSKTPGNPADQAIRLRPKPLQLFRKTDGAEGFGFAALMSVINLATPLADTAGSALYEYVFVSQLAPLIMVSAGFTALALPLPRCMPLPPRR